MVPAGLKTGKRTRSKFAPLFIANDDEHPPMGLDAPPMNFFLRFAGCIRKGGSVWAKNWLPYPVKFGAVLDGDRSGITPVTLEDRDGFFLFILAEGNVSHLLAVQAEDGRRKEAEPRPQEVI